MAPMAEGMYAETASYSPDQEVIGAEGRAPCRVLLYAEL